MTLSRSDQIGTIINDSDQFDEDIEDLDLAELEFLRKRVMDRIALGVRYISEIRLERIEALKAHKAAEKELERTTAKLQEKIDEYSDAIGFLEEEVDSIKMGIRELKDDDLKELDRAIRDFGKE